MRVGSQGAGPKCVSGPLYPEEPCLRVFSQRAGTPECLCVTGLPLYVNRHVGSRSGSARVGACTPGAAEGRLQEEPTEL